MEGTYSNDHFDINHLHMKLLQIVFFQNETRIQIRLHVTIYLSIDRFELHKLSDDLDRVVSD